MNLQYKQAITVVLLVLLTNFFCNMLLYRNAIGGNFSSKPTTLSVGDCYDRSPYNYGMNWRHGGNYRTDLHVSTGFQATGMNKEEYAIQNASLLAWCDAGGVMVGARLGTADRGGGSTDGTYIIIRCCQLK